MNDCSTINYLKIVMRWKKPLLLVFVCSVLFSIIFSGPKFVKPLYKSTAVVYPINIFSYSEESQTEQMLQILESHDLAKEVIDSLDLFRHYKIDRDEPYSYEKILNKFSKRVKIKRTQYESVRIEALDRSPKVAYNIIVNIIESYNNLSLQLMRKKATEVFVIKEGLYVQKQKEVDSLRNIVDTLISQSGLSEYNILKESMRGSFQYLQSDPRAGETLEFMSEKSLELYYNQSLLESEIFLLMELKKEYELALADVNKELVFADVVSEPMIAQKKSYPIRWLIVLLSIFATMTLAFAVVIIIDKQKELKS